MRLTSLDGSMPSFPGDPAFSGKSKNLVTGLVTGLVTRLKEDERLQLNAVGVTTVLKVPRGNNNAH